MIDNISLIHNRWLQDNYRMGALGIIVRDYLAMHPTTIAEYEEFIENWHMPQDAQNIAGSGFSTMIDWYLPSIVENIQNWSYDEEVFYHNIVQSKHAMHWMSLFPHAFSRMPAFDLASAFRWEPLTKKWPDEIRRMFYAQLDSTVSKTFVSIELNRPALQQMNLLRLCMCLNDDNYNAQERANGKPWNAVWTLLQHDDWKHQNDAYFKDLCDKWIRYAPMNDLPLFIQQASTLLRHSSIQWYTPFLDNFICRVRNADEGGTLLLSSLEAIRNKQSNKEKKIPWDYILTKWTSWNTRPFLKLILEQTTWQQELQMLVLGHPDYASEIQKDVLMYRCENEFIGPRDIESSQQLPVDLQHVLMCWVVYRKGSLKKESVKIFQSLYKWHPLYEQEEIMAKYLPGFSGIRTILQSMNVPWRQALAYAEEAMRSKADVRALVRKEFELELAGYTFESQV